MLIPLPLFPQNHHLPMMNNHYLQWFHVIKQNQNKPKMALPSAKTQPEPISLELFNRAAAAFGQKG